MYCFHCGCLLSEYDYCTACGTDVSMYKKIVIASNRFYNEGLERAKIRDLSGAVESLRQSLKFNKSNIEARNLLGLVYLELGEGSAALCEWVISQNMRPDKNIATEYLSMIQNNASNLDMIDQTMRKFNQAYAYCLNGSRDLAVIQLRKVLSLNRRYVRAHLLLALLYMDDQKWEAAQLELRRALEVDHNNTQALTYYREVRRALNPDEGTSKKKSKKKDMQQNDVIRYQSDNEVIIQPINVKEPVSTGLGTLLNILIGLVIGVAASYFLIVPTKLAQVSTESQKTVREISEQIEAKNVRITDLESQITVLNAEKESLNDTMVGYYGDGGIISNTDLLLKAANNYVTGGEASTTSAIMEEITSKVDLELQTDAFINLYQSMMALLGPKMAQYYYDQGYENYRSENYEQAIAFLEKAFYADSSNTDALFYMGSSYRQLGDSENAIRIFQQVIALFPESERAQRSQEYLTELTGQ